MVVSTCLVGPLGLVGWRHTCLRLGVAHTPTCTPPLHNQGAHGYMAYDRAYNTRMHTFLAHIPTVPPTRRY